MKLNFKDIKSMATLQSIDSIDVEILHERKKRFRLYIIGIALVFLLVLVIAFGMALSQEKDLQGAPFMVMQLTAISLLLILFFVNKRRKTWDISILKNIKYTFAIKIDKIKERSAYNPDQHTNIFRSIFFENSEFVISEEDVTEEDFDKLRVGNQVIIHFAANGKVFRITD